jgi:PilZ domain
LVTLETIVVILRTKQIDNFWFFCAIVVFMTPADHKFMIDHDSRLDPAMERRSSKRFPIEQEVSYRTLDTRVASPESGIGKTINISSRGVYFATEQRLRPRKRVEISVNWPAVLDGGCLLKFVAVGRVVRAEDTCAAISIEQYEFRTRRSKELPAAIAEKQARPALPYH